MSDAQTTGETRPAAKTDEGQKKIFRGEKPCLLDAAPGRPLSRVLLRREETVVGSALLHRALEGNQQNVSIEPAGGSQSVVVNGKSITAANVLEDGQALTIDDIDYRFFARGSIENLLKDPDFLAVALDKTTGCLNRTLLLDFLDEAYTDALENGHPLSLVVFGVDDHAEMHEKYGAKDCKRILSRIADLMMQELRQRDHLYHNRAHDFVLVLPNTSADALYPLGERILNSVEESPVETGDGTLMATLSVAILTGPLPRAEPDYSDFLAEGESLLDWGMRRGKNRVIG